MFLKVVFWTFWLTLGFIFHGVLFSYFNDKESRIFYLIVLFFWWGITGVITIVKWRKYRKENPPLTKEQKQKIKQANKKIKYRNSAEYKKKYLSDVEIENSYFGNGILVKDSGPENISYIDIKSGLDRIFDSFGKKSDTPCDLYEFIVKEDNIEYVLSSLEKIYQKSDRIMEESYNEIYNEIVNFFENCEDCLKNDFDLEYLKKNWYICGVQIYDDSIVLSIGIKAAENPEADSDYDICICVDYSTQEADVSFEVVW